MLAIPSQMAEPVQEAAERAPREPQRMATAALAASEWHWESLPGLSE
jgi:hypothetical protein